MHRAQEKLPGNTMRSYRPRWLRILLEFLPDQKLNDFLIVVQIFGLNFAQKKRFVWSCEDVI